MFQTLRSIGLVGYDDCLTRSRSPVRSRARVPKAFVSVVGAWSSGMILRSGRRGREFDSPCTPFWCTQAGKPAETTGWSPGGAVAVQPIGRPGWRSWLAREIHNLEVAGSIPAPGTFCHNTLLWRSWQRFGLMSRWSRVRAPAGADCFLPSGEAGWPSGLRRWF